MADEQSSPLTEAERAELEVLRAEKARRERAELEALRAEQAAADAESAVPQPAPVTAKAPEQPVSQPAPQQPALQPAPAPVPQPDAPVVAEDPAERTFGQRMVLSEGEDADGVPTMPPAQKAIIGICLVAALAAIAYVALSNMGIIG